ncbi:MAG: hypothetical protein HY518_00790 [Candidatus Aenigmarchaeota archaeon]|nr:hypothetical protein [Candidatus Aenigmarchaeota archaeon]
MILLQRRLLRALDYWVKKQMDNGNLFDENRGKPCPSDQYASTFFSMACLKAYRITGNRSYREAAKKSMEYFFNAAEEKRGHAEFNALALACIQNDPFVRKWFGPELDRFFGRLSLETDKNRNVSNNWLAIKLVFYALMRKSGGHAHKARAGVLLEKILALQLPDGLFVDYPLRPKNGFATPLAYHAVFILMLSWYGMLTGDGRAIKAAQRGVDALYDIMDYDGQCLFYGRSFDSIFGYSCLYSALCMLLKMKGGRKVAGMHARICKLLVGMQMPEGCFAINLLQDGVSGRRGWDTYMNFATYNCFSMALLLEFGTDPGHMGLLQEGCTELKESGLFVVRKRDFFVALSTGGQFAEGQSYFFTDTRYWGMQVLVKRVGNKKTSGYRKIRLDTTRHAHDPSFSSVLYSRKTGNRHFCVPVYGSVEVSRRGTKIKIQAAGKLRVLATRRKTDIIRVLHWLSYRKSRLLRLSRPYAEIRSTIEIDTDNNGLVSYTAISSPQSDAVNWKYSTSSASQPAERSSSSASLSAPRRRPECLPTTLWSGLPSGASAKAMTSEKKGTRKL